MQHLLITARRRDNFFEILRKQPKSSGYFSIKFLFLLDILQINPKLPSAGSEVFLPFDGFFIKKFENLKNLLFGPFTTHVLKL